MTKIHTEFTLLVIGNCRGPFIAACPTRETFLFRFVWFQEYSVAVLSKRTLSDGSLMATHKVARSHIWLVSTCHKRVKLKILKIRKKKCVTGVMTIGQ